MFSFRLCSLTHNHTIFESTGLTMCACCPSRIHGIPGPASHPHYPPPPQPPGLPSGQSHHSSAAAAAVAAALGPPHPLLVSHEQRSSSVAELRRRARQHSEAMAMEALLKAEPKPATATSSDSPPSL